MIQVPIYEIVSSSGRVLTPVPDGSNAAMIRLYASSGKLLTNGTDSLAVIDIRATELPLWSEIEAPPEDALSELEGLL